MCAILIGDCRETLKAVPTGSIDCVVTSPPYWGLRNYGDKSEQIGLEKSPDDFVAQMVSVFDLCRNALADHGTLWLNLGDSYSASGKNRTESQASKNSTLVGSLSTQCQSLKQQSKIVGDLKPKDLVGIPWLVAFALRASGWYLRSEIIWHKPNPMPAAVKDRPTTSHEQIFLLSKSPRYYYDWFGVSEETSPNTHSRGKANSPKAAATAQGSGIKQNENFQRNCSDLVNRRNRRSVWKVATKGYKGAHFATFPPKLIEPCIIAGCPETVCCECGKPWERIVDNERRPTRPGEKTKLRGKNSRAFQSRDPRHSTEYRPDRYEQIVGNRDPQRHVTEYLDQGFKPVCQCGGETRKGVVLDPFLGSGTTAQVAQSLGRDWVGCELNEEYLPLIHKRTSELLLF